MRVQLSSESQSNLCTLSEVIIEENSIWTKLTKDKIMNKLSGYSSEDFSEVIGQTIRGVLLEGDFLRIIFDNQQLSVSDGGQSCCESRYLTCDGDDLSYWEGAEFRGLDERPGPDLETGSEYHEQMFIVLQTNRGEQVFAAHNEHNGYYGGFSLNARLSKNV